jgi:hypothetical protein
MIQFFQAGGFVMWWILAFGLFDLVLGALFAFRPDRRKLPAIVAMGGAVLFSVFAGTLADFAAVGMTVPNHPEWSVSPKVHLIILEGFAESMSPGILGFSFLSLVCLECAVGLRKLGISSSASPSGYHHDKV